MGWALFELEIGRHAEQPAAIGRFQAEMAMDLQGVSIRMKIEQSNVYAASGEGELLFSMEQVDDDGVVTRTSAERTAEGFVVRYQSGSVEREVRAPFSRHGYRQECEFADWLAGPPEIGAVLHQVEISLETALEDPTRIDGETSYTYKGTREVIWKGLPVDVALVEMSDDSSRTQMELLPDGTPMTFEMGPFQVRLQDESVARRHGVARIDPWTHIRAGDVGVDPRKLDSLSLTLSRLGDRELPSTHYQSYSRTPGDAQAIVEIRRDHRTGEPEPLGQSERARFLRSTSRTQSDHPRVRALARGIVGGEGDPLAAADRIQQWVFDHVEYDRGHEAPNAVSVIESETGDCSEYALLFVSLARAAGIPAREVGGLIFVPDPAPGFSWHAWSEIHDGEQWVTIDPSWNEVYVNPGHLRLWEDAQDTGWVELMGRLEIQVTDMQIRPGSREKTTVR